MRGFDLSKRRGNMMVDLKKLDEELNFYLRLQTFPLAIRMARKGEEKPPKAKSPFKDLGQKIAICQAFGMARRYGWTLAVTKEDISCPLMKVAFGFEKEIDYYREGNLACGMYTISKEAGAITEAEVPKFQYGQYEAVFVAPVARAAFEPSLFLVYGNSAQVMRLVTARLFKKGGYLNSAFSGRLDCADEVIRTLKTGECEVILPCYGDRVFGLTEDTEMAFTIPLNLSEDVVEGLKGTHQGGVRYPIPSYLRFTPEFPATYKKLNEQWGK